MMFWKGVLALFAASLFVCLESHARDSSTCGELEREFKAHFDEIVGLKLQLEKYKLVDDIGEDIPDECNGFETCAKCLRTNSSPGCGWCFYNNRCSLKENCEGSDVTSQLWVPHGTERCPKIRAVKPHQIASVAHETLNVIIPYMPAYNKPLICSFEIINSTLFTRGKRTDKGVSCPSPRIDKLLPIPHSKNHLPVTLSVQVPNGPSFASTTNFTIYDCRRYTSCSDCTSSPFPCAWCSVGNRCTHDVDEDCKNEVIIFSTAVSVPSIRKGPYYCSRILPYPIGTSNEILIPTGLEKRITVKEENILHYQAISRFHCKAKGHPRVTGQLLGDIIYCDVIKFQVLDRKPISNLTFDVYWGDAIKMDNPQNLHVVVYHCGQMASSCGECLSLPSQYNCGWCEDTDSCSTRDDCQEMKWLDSKGTCTKPEITSFYPKAGLFTQPTNITIKGINLGREFKDIEGGISLINEESELISECKPYEDLYVKYSQIVCLLDVPKIVSESNSSAQGFFEVKVQNEYVTMSEEEYNFVDPGITGMEPVKGLKSGGTFLTIQGNHLDAGNHVEAFVGDIPCAIVKRHSSYIQCITSPSPRTRSSLVRVVIDGEERTSPSYFFYVEDPFVRLVKTKLNANGPSGTLSGGNAIIVEGEYFDYVPNSYIYILVNKEEYPGACTVQSPNEMKCLSPRVPAEVLNFCGEEGFLVFDYGFRMGNVEDVQNMSLNPKFTKFHMHPDPSFKPFSEELKIKFYSSDNLVIEGKNIDSVFDENDITVEIGAEECALVSMSMYKLTCRPPPIQPEAKDGDPNKLPEVVVKVRGVQEHFIGFLQYDRSLNGSP